MQTASIRRVSIYWNWIGGIYSTPGHRVLHLFNQGQHFLRRDSASEPSEVGADLVADLLAALQEQPFPNLDLDRLGLSSAWLFHQAPTLIEERCREVPPDQAHRLAREGFAVLQAHPDLGALLRQTAENDFDSCWTNDYPHLRIKILDDSGKVIRVDSTSQHVFMLPWTIQDVARETQFDTFNAHLSLAVARLLPGDFHGQARLRGESVAVSTLWKVLGDLMISSAPASEEKGEPPSPAPPSHPQDCSLLEAARTGQAARISPLVAAGADLEARGEEGQTPLLLAVMGGHFEVVSALLAAGANVERRDKDGDTPLLHALPQSASLRALLSVLDKDERRDGRHHVGLVQTLLEAGADPNGANSKYGTTPMLKVSQMKDQGALGVAQLLIEAGAEVNVADDVGQTALMHAAFPPFDGEMFRLLASAGANTEARRNDGFTGLTLAAAGGETVSAQAWIEAGANVNAPGANGNTPLMLAAQGWPRILEALLAAGADVNAADADLDTPLHFAVQGYRWSTEEEKRAMVCRLLAAGANVCARNRKGHTALAELLIVERQQHVETEVMREFSSEPQECEPDVTGTEPRESELCRLLREAGSDA